MRSSHVRFSGSQGHELVGRLDLPDNGEPSAFVLFAHCFTCGKDLKPIGNVDGVLTGAGLGVLRFDFTGLGESEGDFADTNFTSNVEDLTRAADYLAREHRAPQVLMGHSLGGSAVLVAAPHIESCRAVVTIAAPYDPAHIADILLPQPWGPDEEVEVDIAGRRFRMKRQFAEDLQEERVKPRLEGLGRALLVLHSPQDRIVGIANAARIFQAARHPKSFVSLDGADHLLLDETDARYVGSVTAAWVARYLEREAVHG